MNKLYVIRGYWNEIHLNYFPVISTSADEIIDIVSKNENVLNKNSVDFVDFNVFSIENPYNEEEMKFLKELSRTTFPEIFLFAKVLDNGYLETPLFVLKNRLKEKEENNIQEAGGVFKTKLFLPDSLIFLSDLKHKINELNKNNSTQKIHEHLNLTEKQYKDLLKYKYIDIKN